MVIMTAGFWMMVATPSIQAQGESFEQAPVNYSKTKARDPITKLQARLRSGELTLDTTSEKAFLKALLDELKIPVESQVLVYSKTSLQNDRISPWKPRAIYYSEDYYVGWVQGGSIELIACDPDLGPIFYLVEVPRPSPGEETPVPRIERSRECLTCHGSSRTSHVPGMLVRSVRPDARGLPILGAGTYQTDHTSPLKERWGGWYVTGESAGPRHMGNMIYEKQSDGDANPLKDLGAELKSLESVIDTEPYLTPRSDIVSLMVLEHQVQVHNALTQAHLTTRRILHSNATLAKHWGEAPDKLSETTIGVLDRQAEKLLKAMLFCDEFKLQDWGVEGDEAFQNAFLEGARRNSDGRSLRDFWLVSRIFKHRLSYMIHSSAFENLHPEMKTRFYAKLLDVLQGKGDPEVYGHLRERERERILGILLETKMDLPQEWKNAAPAAKG